MVSERGWVVVVAAVVICLALGCVILVVANVPPRTDEAFDERVSFRTRWSTLPGRCQRWIVAGLAISLLGACAVWFRAEYGIWPGASYPSEVAYCGRTYQRGDEHRVAAREPGAVVAHFSAPFATTRAVSSPDGPNGKVGDSLTCTMAVFIRTGRSTVLEYDLEGSAG
jgi:hypothetical protein